MGEKFGRDPIWEGHLATEIHASEVQVDAVLFDRKMSLNDVMKLDVGQTLMLESGPNDPIDLKCSGVHLTNGGVMGGSTMEISQFKYQVI